MVEKVMSALTSRDERQKPAGTVQVVDPSPLNWLYINYHVVEELIRVNPRGHIEPAAMLAFHSRDNQTLEVDVPQRLTKCLIRSASI